MTKKQKIVTWLGIIVVVIMGLFPPWKALISNIILTQIVGYRFIFNPYYTFGEVEGWEREMTIIQIDVIRLLVQWILVVVLVGSYLFLTSKKK